MVCFQLATVCRYYGVVYVCSFIIFMLSVSPILTLFTPALPEALAAAAKATVSRAAAFVAPVVAAATKVVIACYDAPASGFFLFLAAYSCVVALFLSRLEVPPAPKAAAQEDDTVAGREAKNKKKTSSAVNTSPASVSAASASRLRENGRDDVDSAAAAAAAAAAGENDVFPSSSSSPSSDDDGQSQQQHRAWILDDSKARDIRVSRDLHDRRNRRGGSALTTPHQRKCAEYGGWGITEEEWRRTLQARDNKDADPPPLHLPPRMMSIVLETPSGRHLPLEVKPSDTVITVKMMIYNNYLAIPAPKQRLTCDGKLLDDNRTLADYAIRSGSTVRLDKMIQLTVCCRDEVGGLHRRITPFKVK